MTIQCGVGTARYLTERLLISRLRIYCVTWTRILCKEYMLDHLYKKNTDVLVLSILKSQAL